MGVAAPRADDRPAGMARPAWCAARNWGMDPALSPFKNFYAQLRKVQRFLKSDFTLAIRNCGAGKLAPS